MSFLKSEKKNKHIFEEIQNAISDPNDVEKAARSIIKKYAFPVANSLRLEQIPIESQKQLEDQIISKLSVAALISKKDSSEPSTKKLEEEIANAQKDAQREVMYMIAVEAIPRYLDSKFYKVWRNLETSNNLVGAELVLELELRNSMKAYSNTLLSGRLDPTKNSSVDYIKRAFAACDPLEIPNIARSAFLSTFLGSIEGLPISVSLSTASPTRPGFPLIYVNAIFEETTLYTRKEIIGQNCKFLQCGKAEPDSVEKLSEALKYAKPVKVEITNFRKNGEPFRNLLAMKPLFDQKGRYAYVIGLQFDVSNETASLSKLQYIDSLMSMLPDNLPYDDSNQ